MRSTWLASAAVIATLGMPACGGIDVANTCGAGTVANAQGICVSQDTMASTPETQIDAADVSDDPGGCIGGCDPGATQCEGDDQRVCVKQPGGCGIWSKPTACPGDDDPCTIDYCVPALSSCQSVPKPAADKCCSEDADCKAGPCEAATCKGSTCVVEKLAGCCLADTACDDEDDCTTDTCDAGHACAHVPKDGCCNVAVACPAPGTCQTVSCVDHACTYDDVAECCATSDDCTAAQACQVGTCDQSDGTCSYAIADDTCAIDGECFQAGDENPTNACEHCSPTDDTGAWTPLDAVSCDDGDACTTVDMCVAGACTGASPTTCPAADACQLAGTCDPKSGGCVAGAAEADGTACDDGNACTKVDTCQSGECTGSDATTCAPSDGCHDGGTCDPLTGACSTPAKTDGAACDDGNACTKVDTCQSGECAGSDATTCAPSDACHDGGTCDPLTGACSTPAKTDGAACDDGNACTKVDTCQSGECTGSDATTCAPSDACHDTGTCDPLTGACSSPAKSDGASCDDLSLCTTSDTCTAGVCGGTPTSCVDDDACTLDTCSDVAGCSHAPIVGCTACPKPSVAADEYSANANPSGAWTYRCFDVAAGTYQSMTYDAGSAAWTCGTACGTIAPSVAPGKSADQLELHPRGADFCGERHVVLTWTAKVAATVSIGVSAIRSTEGGDGTTLVLYKNGQPSGAEIFESDVVGSSFPTGAGINATVVAGDTLDLHVRAGAFQTADATQVKLTIGGVAPKCLDGKACTVDSCDAANGACSNDVTTGCLIGGACIDTGTKDPSSACKACQPLLYSKGYTPLAPATACDDDGDPCSVDQCDAAGACQHVPQSGAACDDLNPWTAGDTCTGQGCAGVLMTCDAVVYEVPSGGPCNNLHAGEFGRTFTPSGNRACAVEFTFCDNGGFIDVESELRIYDESVTPRVLIASRKVTPPKQETTEKFALSVPVAVVPGGLYGAYIFTTDDAWGLREVPGVGNYYMKVYGWSDP